jgi:GTP pyrophosphokinase
VLKPDIYGELTNNIESKRKQLDRYAKEVIKIIKQELQKNGITATLQSRIKHIYGIYAKMIDQRIEFDQVYDIIAFRVIVDTIKDCYGSLGIIHSLWKPVPGRFKDHIAMPKPNMYQSLHTTVIGPYGERIEVQIRTAEMHRIAEKGIAAHWRYKEGRDVIKKEDEKRYEWLKRLIEWQQDLKDPAEFLKTVKMDLFPEEVFVFTPKGDVKTFRKGATPIDFAYSIHTDIGNTCVGAKVNGKMVPLRYNLANGDTVEILTKAKQKPSRDWLRFVVTSRAKQKIKHWLSEEQRERSISLGKEIIEKEFKKYNLNFQKKSNSQEMKHAIETLRVRSVDDLLSRVANARVSLREILEFFVPQEKLDKEDKKELKKERPKKRKQQGEGVLVDGVNDVMIRYAKCCNPVPGDKIVGFISRGRGVTIHTADCSNVLDLPETRLIDVGWDVKEKGIFNAKIRVICIDRKGLLASITTAISDAEANISEATVSTIEDKKAQCIFELEINDLDHLNRVMKRIEKAQGVLSVERLR